MLQSKSNKLISVFSIYLYLNYTMILIYNPHLSNRFRYTLQFVFEEVLKQELEFTSDAQYFKAFEGAKINYSDSKFSENEFYVKPNSILSEDGIHTIDVPIKKNSQSILLFPDEYSDLKFDVFAAIFYLITRYEEYLPFKKDKHGRFEAKESFAYKNGFIDRPIVDEWIIDIQTLLSVKFPQLIWPERKFKFIPTLDIDQAFTVKGKSVIRISKKLLFAFFSLKFVEFWWILMVYFGFKKDPFDQFENIENLHRKYNFRAIYFFLFSKKYNKFDINISVKNKEFRNRIRAISKSADIGIHPSYQSRYDYKLIDEEIHLLSNVLNIPINSSRQHYLKLRFPNTYKSLISLGIANEYSMGYASMPGFRASTTHSFTFFDIKHEQVTFLKVHPFCVMDTTFTTYLNCNEFEAFEHIKQLMANVKKVNGNFTTLWHNESFSDSNEWKGWAGLYEKMLKLATE